MDRLHRQWFSSILALALSAAAFLCVPRLDAAQDADFPRLRTLDTDLADLIQQGVEQSPTFRRLVEGVQQSDLIIHVERHNRFREAASGEFRLVGLRGGQRYVRITLRSHLNRRELTVLLIVDCSGSSRGGAGERVLRSLLESGGAGA